MSIFFTSDTHFGHAKVIEYCNRPFTSVGQMNGEMTRLWNTTVSPEDTVYHLGDFAFGNVEFVKACRYQLNGKIVLVCGNHDRIGKTTLRQIFDEVWNHICVKIGDTELHLSHRPIAEKSPEVHYSPGMFFLNGHVHDKWTQRGRMINVGVDAWNFHPVTWDEIKAKLMI